jgi:hypothetical protein
VHSLYHLFCIVNQGINLMPIKQATMKHHITWTGYLEAIILLLVIYYGYLFFKYYFSEYRRRFSKPSGPQSGIDALPAEIMATDNFEALPSEEEFEQQQSFHESQQSINDADVFLNRAKQAIDIAAKRPYSPDRTISELKQIATAFKALKDSPYLPGIAEVISLKCEETGTATLTEEEVGAWWDDQ